MGDLPEPRFHTVDKDNASVMMKITSTLGRNFIRSKEFKEAQAMGMSHTELTEINGDKSKENQQSVQQKLVSLTLKRKNLISDCTLKLRRVKIERKKILSICVELNA